MHCFGTIPFCMSIPSPSHSGPDEMDSREQGKREAILVCPFSPMLQCDLQLDVTLWYCYLTDFYLVMTFIIASV